MVIIHLYRWSWAFYFYMCAPLTVLLVRTASVRDNSKETILNRYSILYIKIPCQTDYIVNRIISGDPVRRGSVSLQGRSTFLLSCEFIMYARSSSRCKPDFFKAYLSHHGYIP